MGICRGICTVVVLHCLQIELEFRFLWREENRRTRKKTLGAKTRTNNKLNPDMSPEPGIEPRPHCWEAMTSEREVRTLKLKTQHNTQLLRVQGVTPRKIGWEFAACFLKSFFYWRSKSASFPTLFITWPKCRHPFATVAAGTAVLNVINERFLMMVR